VQVRKTVRSMVMELPVIRRQHRTHYDILEKEQESIYLLEMAPPALASRVFLFSDRVGEQDTPPQGLPRYNSIAS